MGIVLATIRQPDAEPLAGVDSPLIAPAAFIHRTEALLD